MRINDTTVSSSFVKHHQDCGIGPGGRHCHCCSEPHKERRWKDKRKARALNRMIEHVAKQETTHNSANNC